MHVPELVRDPPWARGGQERKGRGREKEEQGRKEELEPRAVGRPKPDPRRPTEG